MTNTTQETLKPCPFCSSTKLFISESKSSDKTVTWFEIMHPPAIPCGVSLIDSDKQDLISQWNSSLKIEQSQPFKSLQECKDEVANSCHYSDWDDLLDNEKLSDIDFKFDQAAELYAKQFQPKTVSDEEIDKEEVTFITNLCMEHNIPVGDHWQKIAQHFAKWMREKLTSKQ